MVRTPKGEIKMKTFILVVWHQDIKELVSREVIDYNNNDVDDMSEINELEVGDWYQVTPISMLVRTK